MVILNKEFLGTIFIFGNFFLQLIERQKTRSKRMVLETGARKNFRLLRRTHRIFLTICPE